VKLTAPTLRRSIGLLWRRDGYRRAAARAFSAIAASTGKWIDFSRLEYPRKMKEQQGLQEELNLG